ncbi:MAG: PaaI family thioesterase [Nocardioidaceae bacterium]|nr:PaaI family thioesterase [Nocardioidaceae bacterium]
MIDYEQGTGLDSVLGISWDEVTPDRVVLSWTAGKQHLQPFGIVHGGAYCTAHESAASIAGQVWLGDKGVVVGVNNNTDFLRQAGEGTAITTTATPVHRGRQSQIWVVETADDTGRLLARGQVRLANLDGKPPADPRARPAP